MSYASVMKDIGTTVKPIRKANLVVIDAKSYADDFSHKFVHEVDNLDALAKNKNFELASQTESLVSNRKLDGPYANLSVEKADTFTKTFNNVTNECKKISPNITAQVDAAIKVNDEIARRAARGADIARSLNDLSSSCGLSGFSL